MRFRSHACGFPYFAPSTESHVAPTGKLHAWVYWTAKAADVRAQLIAFVPFTTTGACQKHEPKSYGSHD